MNGCIAITLNIQSKSCSQYTPLTFLRRADPIRGGGGAGGFGANPSDIREISYMTSLYTGRLKVKVVPYTIIIHTCTWCAGHVLISLHVVRFAGHAPYM